MRVISTCWRQAMNFISLQTTRNSPDHSGNERRVAVRWNWPCWDEGTQEQLDAKPIEVDWIVLWIQEGSVKLLHLHLFIYFIIQVVLEVQKENTTIVQKINTHKLCLEFPALRPSRSSASPSPMVCRRPIMSVESSLTARRLYALSVLRTHGMSDSALQIIFRSVVVAKLLDAWSAWWGFTNATDRQRVNAFFRRSIRCGYCPPDLPL